MRRLFPALAGLALSAAAFAAAPTPVGSWTGKFDFKFPPLPATATAQQKQMYAQAKVMMAKTKISLKVNADKSCLYTFTNPQNGKTQSEKGKWTQTGNKVTFRNAKGVDKNPMTATLSANGKSMVAAMPQGQGKVIFTKN